MNDNKTKGLALLYVHLPEEDWPEGVEIPKVGIAANRIVNANELFATWKKFLLLPADYDIIGAYFDITYHEWAFTVESTEIPIGEPGQKLPILFAIYQVDLNEGTRTVGISELRLIP